MMDKFMLDTNMIDHVLEGEFCLKSFSDQPCEYYITAIQREELENISKPCKLKKRDELLKIAMSLEKTDICSFVFDVSPFGDSQFGAGNIFDRIVEKLKEKPNNPRNPARDALIAEASIENGMVLITDDEDLYAVVKDIYGKDFVVFFRALKAGKP